MRHLSRRAVPLAAIVVIALAGCGGTPSVSKDEVAKQTSSKLEQQVGQAPDDVTCPEDLKGEKGEHETCTLTAGDEKYDVTVTVTKVDGDSVNFDIAVADQPKQG